MPNSKPKCLYCEQISDDVPLVALQYKEKQIWICTQHLPLMIHNPQKLVDKLPGAEQITPYDQDQ